MNDETDKRMRGINRDQEETIKKSGLGTSVFMMEMIMVVFFFSLCVAVCILVFVKADSISRLAADTNQAVTRAESIAEIFKAGQIENYRKYPETEKGEDQGDGSYGFAWNRSWASVEAGQEERQNGTAQFYADVVISREEEGAGFMETAAIEIKRLNDGKILYELTVSSWSDV
ncbi:hypothetical protein AALB16_13700 [Lachnospiraceae bacterium 62-35]